METPSFYRPRNQLTLPPGLLHSNHVPTEREVRRIHRIISQKEELIDSLNVERDRVVSILASLDEQICAIRSQVHDHRALLSPARRLPLEILWEIFHHTVSCWPQAPLTLSAVCHRWRQATISESSLWQYLQFSDDIPVNPLPAIRTHLYRSGNQPLTLAFDFTKLLSASSGRSSSYLDETMKSLFTILSDHCYRWQSVNITLPESYMPQFFSYTGYKPAPRLESFNVEITHSGRRPLTLVSVGSTLVDVPCLRSLSLRGTSIEWSALWPLFPSLQRLQLKDVRGNPPITMDHVLDIIEKCPQLEHLEIPFNVLNDRIQRNHGASSSSSPFHYISKPKPSIVRATALQTLHLELYTPFDCGPLLSHLTLPSLKSLSISLVGDRPIAVSEWSHLGAMLNRSKPPLEDLTLAGILINSVNETAQSQLLQDLSGLDRLERLTLKHSTIGDEVFDAMTFVSPDPAAGSMQETLSYVILPRLKHLHLEHCHNFTADALLAMLISRNGLLFPGERGTPSSIDHPRLSSIIQNTNTKWSAPAQLRSIHIDTCAQIRVNHCALIHSMTKTANVNKGREDRLCAKLFFYEGSQRYEMAMD